MLEGKLEAAEKVYVTNPYSNRLKEITTLHLAFSFDKKCRN